MKNDPRCVRCTLSKTCQSVCLLGDGVTPCDVMIITEAPNKTEDDNHQMHRGRYAHMINEMAEAVGWDLDDVYITSAVHCRPPDGRAPKKKEIEACKHWLDYEIKNVKPKFVLLLGAVALQAALGKKGISKIRGQAIEHDGIIYFPTFHPSITLARDNQRTRVEGDFKRFKEIIDFGGIPYERKINSRIVNSWDDFDDLLAALTGVVSCDLETTCLYPWDKNAEIVTIGFGTEQFEWHIFTPAHKDSEWTWHDIDTMVFEITDRLPACTMVFQNGKFDLLWIAVCYDLWWPIDFDTMLAHYAIDENSLHDLETLAQIFLGAPTWDIPLAEKQGDAPMDKIAFYHAHDLYYTRELYFVLTEKLKDDVAVRRVFDHILMKASRAYVRIEHHGCFIDLDKMDDAEDYLLGEIKTATRDLAKWGEINWGSPKQVGELLYDKLKIKCPIKTKKGANSTSESALKQIDHPAVSDLLKLRGARQQHSFFIKGWKPYIVDGRIHPSFKIHGTVTGRPSCEHPNFQQVPRDKRIRSLITAPPGWVLMEADLSQIELRVVAEISNDPTMREAFYNGIDIHWMTAIGEISAGGGMKDLVVSTAEKLMQRKGVKYSEAIDIVLKAGPDACAEIDAVWSENRKKAKAVNFGYVYGMWWRKFKQYAFDNFGMKLTDDDAQQSRIRFFQTYQLERWHKRQKNHAMEYGYVRSLIGRKRRLPHARDRSDTFEKQEALRQAINSPVQSFASDLNLMGLLQMMDEFGWDVFRPVSTVHDAVLAEVRVDMVERVAKRMEEIMTGPDALFDVFNVELAVPMAGETKFGPWGTGVKLSKWKEGNKNVR